MAQNTPEQDKIQDQDKDKITNQQESSQQLPQQNPPANSEQTGRRQDNSTSKRDFIDTQNVLSGNFATPAKEDLTYYTHTSFGTLGTGSTGMNIFVSDGNRSIYFSPAKFNLSLKEIANAEAQSAKSLIIPIVINKPVNGTNNQFISKTIKVAFQANTTNLRFSGATLNPERVLLCQYLLSAEGFSSYKIQESFGIFINLDKYKEIKTRLFGNVHSINQTESVDW